MIEAGILAQEDAVVVRLGHLAAIQAGQFGRLGEQRLRLGENYLAAALEIPEQPLAVDLAGVPRPVDEFAPGGQRVVVAFLLEFGAQLVIELGALGASFFTAARAFSSNPDSRP